MKKPSITIIVLDTLRLDTFNKINQEQGMSLSRLGRFLYFDSCVAPSSWTLPSHASLFTGMYPSEHGAHETRQVKALDIQRIKLRQRTFISELKQQGYKTYAISANPYVHPIYGFSEFDDFKEESYFVDIWGSVVEVADRLKPMIAKYRNEYGSDLLKISSSMLRQDPNLFFEAAASSLVLTPIAAVKKLKAKFIDGWPIEKGGKNTVRNVRAMNQKTPFFLFINLMEPHDPYTSSKKTRLSWVTPFMKGKLDPKLVDLWKRLYLRASRKGFAYAYEMVRTLIEKYGDNQIIILTSDHGQEFNEHGFVGHGTVLHDEVVRVPLAIMLPKNFKEVKGKGRASLVNIRAFLSAALRGDANALQQLFSKEVYAESFGIPANISNVPGIDMKKLLSYEKTTKRRFA